MANPIVVYVATATEAADFKARGVALKDEYQIATLKDFGTEDPEQSFQRIAKYMKNGIADWTIFHLPSVGALVGDNEFIEKIKWLIREGCTKRSKTVIIDSEGKYAEEAKPKFLRLGVMIVNEPSEIGVPFDRMLSPEQLEQHQYNEKYSLFADMDDKPKYDRIKEQNGGQDASADAPKALFDDDPEPESEAARSDGSDRLVGMFTDTPTEVERVEPDPFAELDSGFAEEGNDPFSDYDDKMSEALNTQRPDDYDPFAAAMNQALKTSGAGAAIAQERDPFADPFGDPFADSFQQPAAPASQDPFNDPFGDPFSDTSGASSATTDPFGDDMFADAAPMTPYASDPFADSDPFSQPKPEYQNFDPFANDDPFGDPFAVDDAAMPYQNSDDVFADPFARL